ncbi:hypothetical protein Plano_1433 [Planococcus sp. PAMC 21323]|uniref:VTT domain-containing protein n=1 Tax=Planococcus sp. PAMC 21323 TaxID=1526927 RepID=UPI000585D29B|nr:VTT domain-containing protein [Planococcus sp. PAMC 21323]AIY05398.1 hypothetical protein Plano_1433 [Planococcus sp. PAMC 21323]
MSNITAYLDQYGYIVLFVALLLEMFAFPVPGEILMTYSGFLVYQHNLNWGYSILAAAIGTSIGMTTSYFIGYKVGAPFFIKYGTYFHMGPLKMEKTSLWFNKHGNKLLIIAYFIPGVRHITGYFSGIVRVPFRIFALYAYMGAFLWVSLFITLGKILGPQWEQFHTSIKTYLIVASFIAAVILTVIYTYKKYKKEIKDLAIKLLEVAFYLLHSRKKIGLFLTFIALATLIFFLLMLGLIQDFLGNEFNEFNQLIGLIIHYTFSEKWTDPMVRFSFIGSRTFLIMLLVLTSIWLFWKGRNRAFELTALLLVASAGEVYEESLRRIFHIFSPLKQSFADQLYSFPSEQSFMTLVIYGFTAFLLARTIDRITVRTVFLITTFLMTVLIAISRLYLGLELPSEVVAGYIFGGVWLGFAILVFEILLLLKYLDSNQSERKAKKEL